MENELRNVSKGDYELEDSVIYENRNKMHHAKLNNEIINRIITYFPGQTILKVKYWKSHTSFIRDQAE